MKKISFLIFSTFSLLMWESSTNAAQRTLTTIEKSNLNDLLAKLTTTPDRGTRVSENILNHCKECLRGALEKNYTVEPPQRATYVTGDYHVHIGVAPDDAFITFINHGTGLTPPPSSHWRLVTNKLIRRD